MKPVIRTLWTHDRQKNHSKLRRGRARRVRVGGGGSGIGAGAGRQGDAAWAAAQQRWQPRAAVAPAADDLRLRGGRLQQQATRLVKVRVRLQRPRELGRLRVRHQGLHSTPGGVGHL